MMKTQPTYDDVNLILQLYELRREERMRQARNWFAISFNARTMDEFNALCPLGSDENAFFRMVVTYWEMVASFITSGILNEELFFQSGRELLFVWEKVRDLVPQVREASQDPTVLKNLETVANSFINWLNSQSPKAYPAWSARVRELAQSR
ncbi:MAG: hypothetical protein HY314_14610 [Acidobacteria bacterium]|nr:hypothetical protein [Acidobacteriota bacterium]